MSQLWLRAMMSRYKRHPRAPAYKICHLSATSLKEKVKYGHMGFLPSEAPTSHSDSHCGTRGTHLFILTIIYTYWLSTNQWEKDYVLIPELCLKTAGKPSNFMVHAHCFPMFQGILKYPPFSQTHFQYEQLEAKSSGSGSVFL